MTAGPKAKPAESETLTAALWGIDHGWPAIPIWSKDAPAITWGTDASTDPAQAREWWHPDHKFAKCGLAYATGPWLIVLDVDEGTNKDGTKKVGRKNLKKLEAKHGELIETLEAESPSGGGHKYYRPPAGRSWPSTIGALATDIDTRCNGGYIAAPPTKTKDGKAYRFVNPDCPVAELPEAWADLLTAIHEADDEQPEQPADSDSAAVDAVVAVYPPKKHDLAILALAGWLVERGVDRETGRQFISDLFSAAVVANKEDPSDRKMRLLKFDRAWNRKKAGQQNARDLRKYWGATACRVIEAIFPKPTGFKADPAYMEKPISAADLLNKEFPPQQWLVEGLLPDGGSALLAAAPKIGKSWMGLDLCVSVVSGRPFLAGLQTTRGRALYMGLEDTQRRLQERLLTVMQADPVPTDLDLVTEWPDFTDEGGGFDKLDSYKEAYPDLKLVVVDTFQKVRGSGRKNNTDAYQTDYAAVGKIKQWGDRNNVVVLLIHHTKKGGETDSLHEISGSVGLSGVVDVVWMLKKNRYQADGELAVTGRDVQESQTALNFDPETCRWKIMGEVGGAARFRTGETGNAIVNLLEGNRNQDGHCLPMSAKDIAAALGAKWNTTRSACARLVKKDAIMLAEGGKFIAIDTSDTPF